MNNSVKYTSNYIEVKAALTDDGTAYLVHFRELDEPALTIPRDVFERLFRETGREGTDAVNESLAAGRIDLKQPKGKARAAK